MKIRILGFFALWLWTSLASAQTPIPVVERVFTERQTATRVTLFSNGVVVVTISENGVQGFFRHKTLPTDQYLIYLEILEKAAGELGERPVSSAVSTSKSEVVLNLYIGPDAPRVIRFSPMATVSLPLSRITGAINDLESLVRAASPSAEDLRNWHPRPGDLVELMTGELATVVEVLEEGVIWLEYESTFIRQAVPADQWDTVIRRVVDRK